MSRQNVFITNFKGSADYIVYITNDPYDEKNSDFIKGCKLSNHNGNAINVYITQNRNEANIRILKKNFPSKSYDD